MPRGARVGLGLAFALLIAAPIAAGSNYYFFLATLVAIYTIVAVGLNLLVGYLGQISLGHAGFFAVGAYSAGLLAKSPLATPAPAGTSLSLFAALLLAPVAAGLVGMAVAYPALRVKGPYLAMVTIAFGLIVVSGLVEWTAVTGGPLGITAIPALRIGGVPLRGPYFYLLALACMLAVLLLQRNLVTSPYGRRFAAVRESEIAAASVGISVHATKVLGFALSAALAGLAGGLFTFQQLYISPDSFEFLQSVFFVLLIIFGGRATFLGPFVGALCLTFLPEILHRFDQYRLIIFGTLLVVIMYGLPRGVWGTLEDWWLQRPSFGPPIDAAGAEDAVPPPPSRPAADAGEDLLRLSGIGKRFGGLHAVRNLNMTVKRGTIHALIGPNGAGKTTVLNIVAGVYAPSEGTVTFAGRSIAGAGAHRTARAGIGRTFQNLQVFGGMTALENVLTGFAPAQRSGLAASIVHGRGMRAEDRACRDASLALLAEVGLRDQAKVLARNLAYGKQKVLEIARALATRPQLLLLDEPAAGLNASEIEEIDALIRRIRDRGVTVLLIEHHMDLVMEVSDTVTVLDYGLKIAEGTPAEVQADPKVVEAYLGPGRTTRC